MKKIATAGNVIVPAILALEKLGFNITIQNVGTHSLLIAKRGDEEYVAEDPILALGLVKMIEVRSWDWNTSNSEIDRVLKQYNLG